MEDPVFVATRFAIKRAKQRKTAKVTGDDLLVGLFQTIARFGIVRIGPLTIDLEELGEPPAEESRVEWESSKKEKTAYGPDAVAVFERAAFVAKKDNSPKVEVVHLLVAFAYQSDGLMAELKRKYAFSSSEWRSALSTWEPALFNKQDNSENSAGKKPSGEVGKKEFLSPDEAAEFLGLHTQTIRGYIRTGKLPALRLAGERALRIRRDDLLALLEPYKPDEK